MFPKTFCKACEKAFQKYAGNNPMWHGTVQLDMETGSGRWFGKRGRGRKPSEQQRKDATSSPDCEV